MSIHRFLAGLQAAATAMLLLSTHAFAQGRTVYSLETDPSTFAFNGYALHLRIAPAASRHWVLGAGVYALDLPNAMVDLDAANRGQGWKVRLDHGLGLFAEYFFDPARKGWLVGTQLAVQQYRVTNSNSPGSSARFTNTLLMVHAGYRWYPGENRRWYVQPWMGVGYSNKISGQTTVGTRTYDVAPLMLFATVHIGYTF